MEGNINLNLNNNGTNITNIVNNNNHMNFNSNLSLFEEDHSNLLSNFNRCEGEEGNKRKSNRTVYDPIHGHLEFEDYVWDIIDTPEFQRLRNLFQLGNCSYVFPGATHTRFEHSIGVAYLSNRLTNHLIKSSKENKSFNFYDINSEFSVSCVTLAGLLHDLGHGPFSHLFDRKVIKTLDPSITWEHENGSAMMFDYLIDNNSIDIDDYKKKLIQKLILGETTQSDHNDFYYEPWIFEIVANKKNSIDVDKFDYICRDSYHIGLQSAFVDYDRIFQTSRIINNNLCFNIKNDFNLLSLFQSRYKLFKQVYRHEKIIGIDLMIKDMLVLSNDYFKFTEAIFNPEEYIKLDDHIIHKIEKFSKYETKPNLLQASNLFKRLRQRDIYKYVGEIIYPNESLENIKYDVKIEDILSCDNPKDELYIKPEDLEICKFSIDYGNGRKNPFDSILFYKNENENRSFTVPSNKISLVMPEVFMETYYVLVCKDPNKYLRACHMFKEYLKKLDRNSHTKPKSNLSDSNLTPVKENSKFNVTPRFTSNKRESEYCLEQIIQKNTDLLFNKIN